MSLKEKIEKQKKKMREIQEELQENCKIFFKEESARLFEAYPELTSFSWTQYTPYFNDGDECLFSSWYNYQTINGRFGENDDDSIPKELEKAFDAVNEFLSNFDEDILKEMFGDHAEVIVTKDKVEVEEYSHD